MALIALPFLVGSGVSAAHQLSRSTSEEAGVHAARSAPTPAGTAAARTDRS